MSFLSDMKQMFNDIMFQLWSLSSVSAKCNNKISTASSKEAGCIKADYLSNREISEPSEKTDIGIKLIFEVSELMQTFLQLTLCRAWPADNNDRTMWVEQFRVPEGDKTHCLKFDSILKSELPMEALEMDRKLPHLQNFVLDTARPIVAVMEKLTMLEK